MGHCVLNVSRIDTLFLLHRITRHRLFKLTPPRSQRLTLSASFFCICVMVFFWVEAQAIELTNYFEVHLVKNVSTHPPAVTRIRNITASSFDLRIQGWEDSAATANDVHCIIVEEGAHTLPDGRQLEAHSVVSDQTNGQFATDGTWDQALMEDVSGSIVNTYSRPVVLGQVMSFNDNRASVIYVTGSGCRYCSWCWQCSC